jgi:hypothetical protein
MRAIAAVVALAVLAVPVSLRAWGFAAHRFIMDQAISRLPDGIRPFYERNRTFMIEYSIVPDLLRTLDVADEPPRHFLDMDAYGEYPFDALPRDYDEAVRKFGREKVDANGLLPWRAADIYGRLVKAFDRAGRQQGYALDDIKLMSAVLGHYVADAHMPFHAALNYDGQLTGQRGIHSRFESQLFERMQASLALPVVTIPPVHDIRAFMFDTLLESFTDTEPLLEADRRAAAGLTEYGDEYFERWSKDAGPVLTKRVADAIAATVAVITGAWEEAGRPAVPLTFTRRPAKIGGDRR